MKETIEDYLYVIEEERYTDGQRIIKEGGHGNWMWFILEGAVRVAKETPQGPITVAGLKEGSFIGSLTSLLYGDNDRTATVIAVGDVVLGLLDTERLANEYACLSPDLRRLVQSLAGRLKKTTERSVDFSEGSSFNRGPGAERQVLIERGSSREEAYAIAEGETYVVGQTSKGDFPLITLGRNDVFGNLPFLNAGQEPGCAAVIASKNLKVQRLDTEKLKREYDRLSPTLRNLFDDVASCLSETTRLACGM